MNEKEACFMSPQCIVSTLLRVILMSFISLVVQVIAFCIRCYCFLLGVQCNQSNKLRQSILNVYVSFVGYIIHVARFPRLSDLIFGNVFS